MSGTKDKLLEAALAVLRDHGIAGASARTIATRAGVNQALVFYHFGTVDDLIDAACRLGTQAGLAVYRDEFATVGSLGELLELGRRLHAQERDAGNVAVLAQVLAGAQQDEGLAAAARYSLGLWVTEIEATLTRVLRGSPIADLADVRGLARGMSAAFVGLELFDGVDPAGAAAAFAALEQMAVLVDIFEDLGPVARGAVRGRLRRAGRRR